MKRSIPFNYFEEGQTIYFNISRLEELQVITGKNIGDILNNKMDISVTVSALMVGLKHHYDKKNRQFFQDKIDDCNSSVFAIYETVAKAIMVALYPKQEDQVPNE